MVELAEHRDIHIQRVGQNVQVFPVLRYGALWRIDGVGPQDRERAYTSRSGLIRTHHRASVRFLTLRKRLPQIADWRDVLLQNDDGVLHGNNRLVLALTPPSSRYGHFVVATDLKDRGRLVQKIDRQRAASCEPLLICGRRGARRYHRSGRWRSIRSRRQILVEDGALLQILLRGLTL